jgi:hypothetical protein
MPASLPPSRTSTCNSTRSRRRGASGSTRSMPEAECGADRADELPQSATRRRCADRVAPRSTGPQPARPGAPCRRTGKRQGRTGIDHGKNRTVSYTAWLISHVFSALAEFERNVICERTAAGLQAARARGRLGGRPAKLSANDKQQIRVLLKGPTVRVKDVAKRFGVSVATLYKRVGVVTPEK